MNILLGISGIIIALYTLYCALGMWIGHQIIASENGKAAPLDDDGLGITDHLPKTHIDFIKYYYQGKSGLAWKIGFSCLLISLGLLLTSNPFAVYFLGATIIIDCVLFIFYPNLKEFLKESTKTERVFDAVQYSFLFLAFAVIAIKQLGVIQ